MKDHDQPPNQHNNPHEQGSRTVEQHRKNPIYSQQYSKKTNPHASSIPKNKTHRTPAIALGVLFVVSFALIAFDVINNKPSENKQPNQANNSLVILSKEPQRKSPNLIARPTSKWSVNDGGELRGLKEAYQLQVAQIKSLKRQLLESNQKQHEIKGQLFTKGNPADRTHFAELCNQLLETENLNHDLQAKIELLETELELDAQKISHMFQTIDALAAMTETQRKTKEEAISNFQRQIEELQENFVVEREGYQKNIAEIEEIQHELKEELQSSIQEITALQDNLNNQRDLLESKEYELESITYSTNSLIDLQNDEIAELTTSLSEKKENERENSRLICDLTFNLELEKTLSNDLDSQLNQAVFESQNETKQAEHLKEKNTKRAEALLCLKDRLQEKKNEIHELKTQINVISTYFEQEKIRTEKLHLVLATALEEKERKKNEELNQTLVATLAEKDLEQQKTLSLKRDLENNAEKFVFLQNVVAEKKEDVHGLTHKREEISKNLGDGKDASPNFQEELETLLAEAEIKNAHSLEQTKHEYETQIQEYLAQLDKMAGDYESAKARSEELEQTLLSKNPQSETQREEANDLQQMKLEKKEEIASLQKVLRKYQEEIGRLNAQIDDLSSDLSFEKEKKPGLQKAKDEERETTLITQKSLHDNDSTLETFKKTLTEKERDIQELQEHLIRLSIDLEKEIANSLELHQQIKSESKENENYHQQIIELQQQLSELRKETQNKEKMQSVTDKEDQPESSRQKPFYGLVNVTGSPPFAKRLYKKDNEETPSEAINRPPKSGEISKESITHIVENGETLTSISLYYFGTPKRWEDIYKANQQVIEDKDNLRIGTKLIITK